MRARASERASVRVKFARGKTWRMSCLLVLQVLPLGPRRVYKRLTKSGWQVYVHYEAAAASKDPTATSVLQIEDTGN